MERKRGFVLSVAAVCSLVLLCTWGCNEKIDNVTDVVKEYSGNGAFTIRETSSSRNGIHKISTFVTSNSGMGIEMDGEKHYYDDIAIRYKPVVSNNGAYAYVQQLKGNGYEIVWEGKKVFKSSACLDYLTAGTEKALFAESDMGKYKVTRLYLLDMATGDCKIISKRGDCYIEGIREYDDNRFGVILSQFDSNGNKSYKLLVVDGLDESVEVAGEEANDLMTFPAGVQVENPSELLVDVLRMSGNDRLLYNALKVVGGGQRCICLWQ